MKSFKQYSRDNEITLLKEAVEVLEERNAYRTSPPPKNLKKLNSDDLNELLNLRKKMNIVKSDWMYFDLTQGVHFYKILSRVETKKKLDIVSVAIIFLNRAGGISANIDGEHDYPVIPADEDDINDVRNDAVNFYKVLKHRISR